MMLQTALKKRLKFFDLDIAFSCPSDEMLVLIGPSGGGKTTIIRLLAGLETPDQGKIVFHNQVWFDSDRPINVPTRKRGIGYVFQEYTLFPHLNLYKNAVFAAEDKKEVDSLFELFNISHLRDRKPHMVSGGERQRCAICQALARRPQLLLLDEPLSALDVVTRRELRQELKNLKEKLSIPIIYVTHDINEAFFLADEILSVVAGKEDNGWIQRTYHREPSADKIPKAVREPRLALVG